MSTSGPPRGLPCAAPLSKGDARPTGGRREGAGNERDITPREVGYSCHKCRQSITVIGKAADDASSLRRVDWDLSGGKVTCRKCRKAAG